MIGRIQGTLIANTPPRLIIDCHGVGYEVDVPMSTLYQMPSLGQQVTLLTHFVVREDAQQLFGFATDSAMDANQNGNQGTSQNTDSNTESKPVETNPFKPTPPTYNSM